MHKCIIGDRHRKCTLSTSGGQLSRRFIDFWDDLDFVLSYDGLGGVSSELGWMRQGCVLIIN